jgi:uncharacterized protein
MHLLDVNVLIALGDPAHVHHRRAHQWFHQHSSASWATCPLTQNGFLRILSAPSYPGQIGEISVVSNLLRQICALPGHQFWADDVSLLDLTQFPQLPVSKHLTDLYLLGLAVQHQGKLVTLDRRIDPTVIPGGRKAYLLIP